MDICRNYIFSILLVGVFLNIVGVGVACSQTVPASIPLTRNDSAQLISCDSLYRDNLRRNRIKEACRMLDMQAMIYWRHNYLSEALAKYEGSLELNKRLGNQNGVAGINSNLAFIYADLGEFAKSYELFEKTLAVRKQVGEPVGIISVLINESVVLNNLERFEESVVRLEEALTYARELNDESQMRSVYGMLSETYQKWGNAEKAMYYYEYYKTFNDYVTKQEVTRARDEVEIERQAKKILELKKRNQALELERQRVNIARQAGQLDTLGKALSAQELANQLLLARSQNQEQCNQLLEAQKREQTFWLAFALLIVAIVLAALLLSTLAWRARGRRNWELQHKNELIQNQNELIVEKSEQLAEANVVLEHRNKEIVSSIENAKQVQVAVLSQNHSLRDLFLDSFVYNRPYNIVSGDFYYNRIMPSGKKILVVGDCTGHGVSGGYLTVFVVSALDRAIYDFKHSGAVSILEAVDGALSSLNEFNELSSHSMDVAVCILDESKQEIEFAGTKNGVLICREEKAEYIRGSRAILGLRPSSMLRKRGPIESHILPMKEGTWYYMYSDGIPDQFSEQDKKFSHARLHEMLCSVSRLCGREQDAEVVRRLSEWKGECPQVDDMLLVGFRPV